MKPSQRAARALVVLCLLSACSRPEETPDKVANEFLRVVHRQDCEKAWTFFSAASQEKIKKEAAGTPFVPENLYCMSTDSNRFLSFARGSARLKQIAGTNAVVLVDVREGADVRGVLPTKFKTTEINLVKEGGAWKIDLVTPTSDSPEVLAAKEKVEKEKEAAERGKATAAMTNASNAISAAPPKEPGSNAIPAPVRVAALPQPSPPATVREPLSLIARWTFQNVNVDLAGDDSGIFLAELRGPQVVASPEGKVLRFTGDSQGVRLPQVLLNKRSSGAISLWFRQDDPKVPARVLTRVTRGAIPELAIELPPDGKINFVVSGQRVSSKQQLEAGRFYHLAFVWNDEGQKIFVDGKLDAHGTQSAAIGLAARLTEMGRDPNKPGTTGSRMTIRDLRFYKGYVADGEISSLMQ